MPIYNCTYTRNCFQGGYTPGFFTFLQVREGIENESKNESENESENEWGWGEQGLFVCLFV